MALLLYGAGQGSSVFRHICLKRSGIALYFFFLVLHLSTGASLPASQRDVCHFFPLVALFFYQRDFCLRWSAVWWDRSSSSVFHMQGVVAVSVAVIDPVEPAAPKISKLNSDRLNFSSTYPLIEHIYRLHLGIMILCIHNFVFSKLQLVFYRCKRQKERKPMTWRQSFWR